MWFTENPWPPAMAFLVASGLLVVAWSGNRRTIFLAIAAVCLLAVPIVFAVEQLIVTTGEQIEDRIYALRDTVISDDLDATLDFFSKTAVVERGLVTAGMTLGRLEPDVRITDLSVDVKANDTVAISHFRANGTFVGRSGMIGQRHVATRWNISWRKEAGEWKIFALDRLNPVNGEPINVLWGE